MSAPYEVKVVQVDLVPLAAVKAVAWAQNIGPKIGATLPLLHGKLKELSIGGTGRDVVVYYPHLDGNWEEPPGIRIDVAVQLQEPLSTETEPLVRSETPGGRAAMTVHHGPYANLPQAHTAIHAWCRENNLPMTGRNWELYGEHHDDDPSRLVTEVYYELK